jgi:hypothetical protein
MGTGSFPGVESGRGVTLTPHPILMPRSKKQSRAIPILSLRAIVACKKSETYLHAPFTRTFPIIFTVFLMFPSLDRWQQHSLNLKWPKLISDECFVAEGLTLSLYKIDILF